MRGGRVYWYATENTPEGGRHADEKSHVERLFRWWHSPIEALISERYYERADMWERLALAYQRMTPDSTRH